MHRATVIALHNLSPKVKHLTLQVKNPNTFNFKCGQWVDFVAPKPFDTQVTGYSFTSSPHYYHVSNGCFNLAVQRTDFPPTHWIHDHCKVGDEVEVTVGGGFTLPEHTQIGLPDLLLIAGGVGINPLFSFLCHCLEDRSDLLENHPTNQLVLLHSAKQLSDLLFRDDIIKLLKQQPTRCQVEWFLTGQTQNENYDPLFGNNCVPSASVHQGRLTAKHLKKSIELFPRRDNIFCYLCGPPPMVDNLVELLAQFIPRNQIVFESWWKSEEHTNP